MWQTNSWLVPFGCRVDGERVKPVGPHVGTCVCAPATLSLKISCQLGKQHHFSEVLKVLASPLKKEDSDVLDTWPRGHFPSSSSKSHSIEVGACGLMEMEVGWTRTWRTHTLRTRRQTDYTFLCDHVTSRNIFSKQDTKVRQITKKWLQIFTRIV